MGALEITYRKWRAHQQFLRKRTESKQRMKIATALIVICLVIATTFACDGDKCPSGRCSTCDECDGKCRCELIRVGAPQAPKYTPTYWECVQPKSGCFQETGNMLGGFIPYIRNIIK